MEFLSLSTVFFFFFVSVTENNCFRGSCCVGVSSVIHASRVIVYITTGNCQLSVVISDDEGAAWVRRCIKTRNCWNPKLRAAVVKSAGAKVKSVV